MGSSIPPDSLVSITLLVRVSVPMNSALASSLDIVLHVQKTQFRYFSSLGLTSPKGKAIPIAEKGWIPLRTRRYDNGAGTNERCGTLTLPMLRLLSTKAQGCKYF